jgi:PAS domain S-box-containing protein
MDSEFLVHLRERLTSPTLESLFDAFFLNSYDGFFIFDNEGRLLLTNPAAQDLIGIPLDDLIGRHIRDLIRSGYYDQSPALRSLATGKRVTGLVRTRTGTEVISTSLPVFDNAGRIRFELVNARPLDCILEGCRDRSTERARRVSLLVPGLKERPPVLDSPWMLSHALEVDRMAATDANMLIFGETGVGKNLLARAMHERSARSTRPFVEINCASIPESLFESELFGYSRGAFTGADSRGKEGLIEAADNGTLFLDEIAEMPVAMQAKLLGALDTGRFRRVGSTDQRSVNVRIVAATNKDLAARVAAGSFRDDLYYRLNVLSIRMPPLRERRDDLAAFAGFFLADMNRKYKCAKAFAPGALDAIVSAPWPGNIRQLRNVIERAVLMGGERDIEAEEMLDAIGTSARDDPVTPPPRTDPLPIGGDLKRSKADHERERIRAALEASGGNVTAAAGMLGVHRTVLHKKIRRYALKE